MSKNLFLEYFKTVFYTIVIAIAIVFIIILFMIHQISNENQIKQDANENATDLQMVDFLIAKNKYLREEHPENYKLDSKLGFLYEIKKDFKNAEIEYKIAILKVPYSEFKPYYDLALLYVNTARLEEAQAVMDKIEEKPLKRLIKYKAEIYSKLGDKYYEKANYEEAALRYKKSLSYYEVLKDKKNIKQLKWNLASSYVYLADQKVAEMKIDEAIVSINTARLIVDAPVLTYKLGVLLSETDPALACQCFDKVFEEEPSLINYEQYYNILKKLADEAQYMDESEKVKLYEYKIKKLKKYYNDNLLSVSDIKVSEELGYFKINRFFKHYTVVTRVSLQNTSKYQIDSLYLEFVFKNKDEVIERFFKQIVENTIPLTSGETLPYIYIKTKKLQITEDIPEKITVEIYASKKEDSRKLLVDEIVIKRPIREPNIIKTKIQQFLLKYIYPHVGAGFFG